MVRAARGHCGLMFLPFLSTFVYVVVVVAVVVDGLDLFNFTDWLVVVGTVLRSVGLGDVFSRGVGFDIHPHGQANLSPFILSYPLSCARAICIRTVRHGPKTRVFCYLERPLYAASLVVVVHLLGECCGV